MGAAIDASKSREQAQRQRQVALLAWGLTLCPPDVVQYMHCDPVTRATIVDQTAVSADAVRVSSAVDEYHDRPGTCANRAIRA